MNASSVEIEGDPPQGILELVGKKVLTGAPVYKGSHGLKEYCYKKGNIYVIYSSNSLGEGYGFYDQKPLNRECVESGKEIPTTNRLGIYVGSSSVEASRLLGFDLISGNNSISWHYQRSINGVTFDDVTSVEVTVKNNKVAKFELFNTVTN